MKNQKSSRKKYQKKVKEDLYQKVTDRMIELIESGVNPWLKPWSSYGAARNIATNHIYTGINSFWLNLTDNEIPYFMTFNQAKARGGKIRKGAKAEQVFFYKKLYIDKANDSWLSRAQASRIDSEDLDTIFMLKCFNVFNVADIEEIDFDFDSTIVLKENERIDKCETIISGMVRPPRFVSRDLNRAFYRPSTDELNMPKLEQFKDSSHYYATFFHELAHSTGSFNRLKRDGIVDLNKFGSHSYSFEELIAEMSSAMLMNHVGYSTEDLEKNSAAYLRGWLKALKNDKKFIFRAATQAQRAVKYILNDQQAA